MLKIEIKKPEFTAHNIKINDEYTISDKLNVLENDFQIKHIKSCLKKYCSEKARVVDLGCLEGGFAAEIAKNGFSTLGIEIRESNMKRCRYVKRKLQLPNLEFIQDDVRNIKKYGEFDCTLCCGILYHLDDPKKFLEDISSSTKKILVLNTHFSLEEEIETKYNLSGLTENEGLKGRWYQEFTPQNSKNDTLRASSWQNHQSFWILKDHLIETLYQLGFNKVEENIYPKKELLRGTFTGIKF